MRLKSTEPLFVGDDNGSVRARSGCGRTFFVRKEKRAQHIAMDRREWHKISMGLDWLEVIVN